LSLSIEKPVALQKCQIRKVDKAAYYVGYMVLPMAGLN